MKFEVLILLLGAAHSIDLFATTAHFQGENQMVVINSTTGLLTPVIKNFSTWDIPDAAFDSVHNILYTCTRLTHESDNLGVIAYDRTGAKIGKQAPLDPAFKPDNLGDAYFDSKENSLVMFYQPYDMKASKTINNYVEVDPGTGKTTKTIEFGQGIITSDWELVLESSAYDAVNRIAYQFWEAPGATGMTLAAVNLITGVMTQTVTKLPLGEILQDPIFYDGKIYGFGGKNFLVSIEPKTGELATVSKIGLAHNIGPWYPTLFKASPTGPQLLYVSNTTNGGPGSQATTSTLVAQGVRKVDKDGRRYLVSQQMEQHQRGRTASTEDEKNDDDGFTHTHTSLVGFNLESGDIVDGPVALSAPVTFLSALDSA
jgi:hypothetical protein